MGLVELICGLTFLVLVGVSIRIIIIDTLITIKCSDLVIKYRFLGGHCWGMAGCGNDNCRLRHHCRIYQ